jgi:hypothetical protein
MYVEDEFQWKSCFLILASEHKETVLTYDSMQLSFSSMDRVTLKGSLGTENRSKNVNVLLNYILHMV